MRGRGFLDQPQPCHRPVFAQIGSTVRDEGTPRTPTPIRLRCHVEPQASFKGLPGGERPPTIWLWVCPWPEVLEAAPARHDNETDWWLGLHVGDCERRSRVGSSSVSGFKVDKEKSPGRTGAGTYRAWITGMGALRLLASLACRLNQFGFGRRFLRHAVYWSRQLPAVRIDWRGRVSDHGFQRSTQSANSCSRSTAFLGNDLERSMATRHCSLTGNASRTGKVRDP
jgi:hypothetical protein